MMQDRQEQAGYSAFRNLFRGAIPGIPVGTRYRIVSTDLADIRPPIQTDAAISPPNHSVPLAARDGRVVGIAQAPAWRDRSSGASWKVVGTVFVTYFVSVVLDKQQSR